MGRDLADDLIGRVSFGELAFELMTLDAADAAAVARVRGRARRAGRSRLHADRDRGAADLPERARCDCRARWPPGCSAAGRASSASPRTPARSSPRRSRRRRARRRPTPSGTSWRVRPCALVARPAGSSRGWAITCTRTATRARRVIIAIAREEGVYGPHLALFEAIGRVAPEVLGKQLPLNGAGVCGAALADHRHPARTAARGGPARPLRRTAGPTGRGDPPSHRERHLPRGRVARGLRRDPG